MGAVAGWILASSPLATVARADQPPDMELAAGFLRTEAGDVYTGTVSYTGRQTEYRALRVGDEVVYVRHEDLPGDLVDLLGWAAERVGAEGGYADARGATEATGFDIPASSLGDPAAVRVRMVAPSLFYWESNAEDLTVRNNVTRFTFTSALEIAIELASPVDVDLDFDDLVCGENECCDDLFDVLDAVVADLIENPPTTLGALRNALEDAVETAFVAGLTEPDDPTETGWLYSCFDLTDTGDDAGRWVEAALMLGDLIDLTEIVIAQLWGPGGWSGQLDACWYAGCPGACVEESGFLVCTSCATDADCDDGDACNGAETCADATCVDGAPIECEWDEVCSEGSCVASDPVVSVYPDPIDVGACAWQGGHGFDPGSNVTLVYEDLAAGTAARETATVDAWGWVDTYFGLDCGDADAAQQAEDFLDRVDPDRAGFADRPMELTVEYWADGELRTTSPVAYSVQYTGSSCVPACDARECGDDGCGGTCGVCTGSDVCDGAGTCATSSTPRLTVSGTLSGSHRWTTADSPVLVSGDLTVTGTLTIDPGVVVQAANAVDIYVTTGTLRASGTVDQPIVFTSDGETSASAWGGIRIDGTSGDNVLDHVDIRYGGQDSGVDFPLLVDGRELSALGTIELVDNRIQGIALGTGTYSGDVTLAELGWPYWVENDITINPGVTLTLEPGVIVKMADENDDLWINGRLVAEGTTGRPIIVTSSADDAAGGDTGNDGSWGVGPGQWGGIRLEAGSGLDDSSLRHVEIRYGGSGSASDLDWPLEIDPRVNPTVEDLRFVDNSIDTVVLQDGTWTADVTLDITELPYWIQDDVTVNPGVTLTLEPGVTLKFADDDDDLWVEGRLVARGSSDRPVVLTSGDDDTWGGDVGGDGSTAGAAGDWGGVYLADEAGLAASVLDEVIVRFGGSGSAYDLDYPILLDPRANPEIGALQLDGNRIDAIALETGDWAEDVSLDQAVVPYWIEDDVTVNPGVTLTLHPGVVLKFADVNDDLWVEGRLVAVGTAAAPIVLTAARDDSAGGDSDAGGSSAGVAGSWGGVSFATGTLLAPSELDEVEIRFAGSGSSYDLAYPILLDARENPVLGDVRLVDNRVDAIALATGTYTEDVLLDQVVHPYWVEDDLGVSEGTTLTLQPGVVLKFADANDDLRIDGRLVALGTADAPIVLTAAADDSAGGDSDAGGSSSGSPGSWGGVWFDTDTLLAASQLDEVEIRYAGSASAYDLAYPIYLDARENPELGEVRLVDNRVDAVGLVVGIYADDVVLDQVAAPYWIEDDLEIEYGSTLRLEAGVVLKFADANDDLYVRGALEVEGAAGATVVLTGIRDDERGGDSNADGSSRGSAGAWGGVVVDGTADLRWAEIRYGGSGSTYDADCALEVYGTVLVEASTFESNDDAVCARAGIADLGGGGAGSAGGNSFVGHTSGSTSYAYYNGTSDAQYAYANTWGVSDPEGVIFDRTDSGSVGEVYWNSTPVAVDQSVSTREDTSVDLTLDATDPEGTALRWTVTSAPAHGALSGTAPDLRYTPSRDWNGTDTFRWTASDGSNTSNVATVTVVVSAEPDAPVATAGSVTTSEDVAVGVTLTATDVDGDALSYHLASEPLHGTLSGSPPALVYTPDPDWNGTDSFRWYAEGAGQASATVTNTLVVQPVNDAPVAEAASIVLDEDESASFSLEAWDVDGDALAWSVVTPPAHGRLDGGFTYAPDPDWFGADAAVVAVTDGVATVTVAVAFEVRPVPDAPVASDLAVSVPRDTPTTFRLVASDGDGDALVWTAGTSPAWGTLSGGGDTWTYTPASGWVGTDTASFVVSDGSSSAEARVTFDVWETNHAPEVSDVDLETDEDTPITELLVGTDLDGDPLTWAVVEEPAFGVAELDGDELSWTPDPDFHGEDAMVVQAWDGREWSAVATVSLLVHPVNDAPSTADVAVTTVEDTSVDIPVGATDVDGDALVKSWSAPSHGTVTDGGGGLTYTPSADFWGSDTFVVTFTDPAGLGASAAVTVEVTAQDDPPRAADRELTLDRDTSVAFTLDADDVDGDALTYRIDTSPLHGTLVGADADWTYVPDAGFVGEDSVGWSVTDGRTSASATVRLTVRETNEAPTATGGSVDGEEDTPMAVELTGSDPDGDALTYTVTQAPRDGALSGDPPSLTYTPRADWSGEDELRFVVSDGETTSGEAVVQLRVAAVNDAPTATAGAVSTLEDSPVAITLAAVDPESDPLSFVVVDPPTLGTLSGSGATLTYTPAPDGSGVDSFRFVASDGVDTGPEATVTVEVSAVNDPPVAADGELTTTRDVPVEVELVAWDVDSSSLTFRLVDEPLNGTLTEEGTTWVYTPGEGFVGADRFTWVADDGEAESAEAVMVVEVAAPGDRDGDGVADEEDVCPDREDPDQADLDGDGAGDACDDDDDGDGIPDAEDGCPDVPDDGTDTDGDGLGDACDPTPEGEPDTDPPTDTSADTDLPGETGGPPAEDSGKGGAGPAPGCGCGSAGGSPLGLLVVVGALVGLRRGRRGA